MKSLETILVRIAFFASLLLILACGGLFGDDDNSQQFRFGSFATRLENQDSSPVHMWVDSGSMTDANRIEPGASLTGSTSRDFTYGSVVVTVFAERPGMARQSASKEITYQQAIDGWRVLGRWNGSELTAFVVPPDA